MSVHHGALKRSEEGVGYPRTGDTNGCKPEPSVLNKGNKYS